MPEISRFFGIVTKIFFDGQNRRIYIFKNLAQSFPYLTVWDDMQGHALINRHRVVKDLCFRGGWVS